MSNATDKPRLALIDGDSLVYDAGKRAEHVANWQDGLWSQWAWENEAVEHLHLLLNRVVSFVGAAPDRVRIALSDYDQENWRNGVMPEYKKSRKEKHSTNRPLLWAFLREYIQANFKVSMYPGCEGDDVLGVLSTDPNYAPTYQKVICSIDKDMQTIPGHLYNFHHAQKDPEVRFVHTYEADYFHMLQTLMGDATDGYPGCPGVGKVGAKKLLDPLLDIHHFEYSQAWPVVVKAYAKAGLSEGVALQNARVARICRLEDYNQQTGEVILWKP